jgi:hypothetical protein
MKTSIKNEFFDDIQFCQNNLQKIYASPYTVFSKNTVHTVILLID